MSSLDKIITEIIEDTPVAEVPGAINELKLLVDKNIASELEEAVSKYNTDNYISVQFNDDGDDIILSKYSKESDDTFADSAKGYRIKVDHLKTKAISVEEIPKDGGLNGIYESLLKYVDTKYPNVVKFGVFRESEDFKVIIVGEKNSPSNFWNGRWISEYTFSNSKEALEGFVKIDVHYYEDGNVRLQYNEKLESSSVKEQQLGEKINELEDSLQKKLNKSFFNLNESKFKNLRRQLPVTRSKMNWGKAIGNYRLGRDVANQ